MIKTSSWNKNKKLAMLKEIAGSAIIRHIGVFRLGVMLAVIAVEVIIIGAGMMGQLRGVRRNRCSCLRLISWCLRLRLRGGGMRRVLKRMRKG